METPSRLSSGVRPLSNMWRGMRATRAGMARLLLLSSVVVACDAFKPTGCDVCTTSAVIAGRVTTGTGQPVLGAEVLITAARDSCNGRERWVFRAETGDPGPALTDAAGEYRTRLRSHDSPGLACLTASVTPPPGTDLPSHTVTGTTVLFDDDWPRESRTSARIDIRLGPQA